MLCVLHNQYHACWCSGDFRSQGINRHGIDPLKSEYSVSSIRRFNWCLYSTSPLYYWHLYIESGPRYFTWCLITLAKIILCLSGVQNQNKMYIDIHIYDRKHSSINTHIYTTSFFIASSSSPCVPSAHDFQTGGAEMHKNVHRIYSRTIFIPSRWLSCFWKKS